MQIQMPRLYPDDRPVLAGSRMVSVIVQARDLAPARAFYAQALGLPLIADDGRCVRLDAGSVVLELRRAAPNPPARRADGAAARLVFSAADRDGLAASLAARGVAVAPPAEGTGGAAWFADPDGHPLALVSAAREGAGLFGVSVAEVALPVDDPDAAAALFEGGLEMRAAGREGGVARYDAGGVELVTLHAPGAEAAPGGVAPVIHVEDLGDSVWRLASRGIPLARTVTYSRAGGAARVEAPSGHVLWLWEPSDEARDGPGGRKLEALLGGRA